MTYILSRQLQGGKYSKWIIILQEFDLEVIKSKWKKSLVFAELLCDLPSIAIDSTTKPPILDEYLFLILSSDPWYGYILIHLQTQTFQSNTSRLRQWSIRYRAKDYLIIGNTLYRRGIDIIFHRFLRHEEDKKVLNDYHSSTCGGHLSSYAQYHNYIRWHILLVNLRVFGSLEQYMGFLSAIC